jgi:hypothetical protein
MEQPQFTPGRHIFSWQRLRVLLFDFRIRMANRIVSITKESENSVRVISISGLWGRRPLRVEKRGKDWIYVGIIEQNPHVIVL